MSVAKKIKWNDSEEVIVKYAQKDSHGTDINIAALNTALNNKLATKPDGTNDLIVSNKVSTKYLPDTILGQLLYGGTVVPNTAVATLSSNAKTKLETSSNTITLTNNTAATTGYKANEGIYYIASANGTMFSLELLVGDWVLSTGSGWVKVDNTDAVKTVQIKGTANQISSSDETAQNGNVVATLGLADNYGDNKNPYAAKNPHYFLAGPDSGSTGGAPGFRSIKKADLPELTASDVGALPASTTYVASVKTLKTDATTAQTASASESISGSGTITLHKVSKTGSYNDLLNKPTFVSSVNGASGDITNVAKTNVSNTFTLVQNFSNGITLSDAGDATSESDIYVHTGTQDKTNGYRLLLGVDSLDSLLDTSLKLYARYYKDATNNRNIALLGVEGVDAGSNSYAGLSFNGVYIVASPTNTSESLAGGKRLFYLPTKSEGIYTLATTADIPSVSYPVTDIKISTSSTGGTSLLSGTVATLVTGSAYNASTNKIATINDIANNIPITVEDFTIE